MCHYKQSCIKNVRESEIGVRYIYTSDMFSCPAPACATSFSSASFYPIVNNEEYPCFCAQSSFLFSSFLYSFISMIRVDNRSKRSISYSERTKKMCSSWDSNSATSGFRADPLPVKRQQSLFVLDNTIKQPASCFCSNSFQLDRI